MADTWLIHAEGIAFAATKNMCAVLNTGTNVIRVRRIGLLNNQTVGVSGVICLMEIRRYASGTLGSQTSLTPIPLDSTNTALSNVTAGHTGTLGGTPTTLRRIIWSSDEAAASTASNDEWECLVPFNVIWDVGYGDSNLQSLAIRQNEMLVVYNVSGAAGLVDIWIEFTNEAS